MRAGVRKGDGIIPACAGNTRRAKPVLLIGVGSSPRVRGTQVGKVAHGVDRGIIPACAGNTSSHYGSTCQAWDHPRVCGEHFRANHQHLAGDGIIPACAGNTYKDRMRVEYREGSSPRVRGTPTRFIAAKPPTGIIPACAGNT